MNTYEIIERFDSETDKKYVSIISKDHNTSGGYILSIEDDEEYFCVKDFWPDSHIEFYTCKKGIRLAYDYDLKLANKYLKIEEYLDNNKQRVKLSRKLKNLTTGTVQWSSGKFILPKSILMKLKR